MPAISEVLQGGSNRWDHINWIQTDIRWVLIVLGFTIIDKLHHINEVSMFYRTLGRSQVSYNKSSLLQNGWDRKVVSSMSWLFRQQKTQENWAKLTPTTSSILQTKKTSQMETYNVGEITAPNSVREWLRWASSPSWYQTTFTNWEHGVEWAYRAEGALDFNLVVPDISGQSSVVANDGAPHRTEHPLLGAPGPTHTHTPHPARKWRQLMHLEHKSEFSSLRTTLPKQPHCFWLTKPLFYKAIPLWNLCFLQRCLHSWNTLNELQSQARFQSTLQGQRPNSRDSSQFQRFLRSSNFLLD